MKIKKKRLTDKFNSLIIKTLYCNFLLLKNLNVSRIVKVVREPLL